MSDLVFIDIETTGLISGYHEIIEIAIIYEDGTEYYHKIKPNRLELADPRALSINRFTSKAWRNAIEPAQLAYDLSEILKDKIIVGHNPHFDIEFIEDLLHKYDQPCLWKRRYVDTITLAFEHLKPLGLTSCSLDECRRFFKWSTVFSHTALQDAKDCRRLYYKLARASSFKRFSWLLWPKIKSFMKMGQNIIIR